MDELKPVKIIAIHKDDAWYFTKSLIGCKGNFREIFDEQTPKEFSTGYFHRISDADGNIKNDSWYFHAIKFEAL